MHSPSVHCQFLFSISRSVLVLSHPLFQLLETTDGLLRRTSTNRSQSLIWLLLADHVKQRSSPFTFCASDRTVFLPPLQRVAVLFGKLLDNGLVFSFDFVPRSNRSRYSTKVNTSQVGIAATFPKLPDRSCMRSGSLRPHLLQDN